MPRRENRVLDSDVFYHVTAHAVDTTSLYSHDSERELFISIMARVVRELRLVVHTWCQMTTHYHLFVQTPEANLDECMLVLNGSYARWVNRLRKRRGHVFDAPYNPVVVKDDAHFKEVLRYVVLNPVRSGICKRPEDWRWSAHRALAGLEWAPRFLETRTVLGAFGSTPERARRAYCRFVAEGSPYASVEGILELAPTTDASAPRAAA